MHKIKGWKKKIISLQIIKKCCVFFSLFDIFMQKPKVNQSSSPELPKHFASNKKLDYSQVGWPLSPNENRRKGQHTFSQIISNFMDVNLFDIFGFPFGFPGSTPVWMTFVGLTRGECWDVCHGGKCDKRSWQKKNPRRLSQSPRLSGEQKKSSKWSYDTLRKAPWAYRYASTPIYRVMASCVTKCNVIQYQLRFLAWNN